MPCCPYSDAFRYPATEAGAPWPTPCSVPVGQIASAMKSGRWPMTCLPKQPHVCGRQPCFLRMILAGASTQATWMSC